MLCETLARLFQGLTAESAADAAKNINNYDPIPQTYNEYGFIKPMLDPNGRTRRTAKTHHSSYDLDKGAGADSNVFADSEIGRGAELWRRSMPRARVHYEAPTEKTRKEASKFDATGGPGRRQRKAPRRRT